MSGCPAGRDACAKLGIGAFVNNKGYTSVAVATALLVSVALVLCVASAEWVTTRAADVQQVADAAAMAGANAVARFCTVAQVVDACVLSLGLAGVSVLGAGLVLSAVPGARVMAGKVMDEGMRVLKARNSFAKQAVAGLQRLEQALPGAIVLNSASCVRANCRGGLSYAGAAIPFPLESGSSYASLGEEVDAHEVSESGNKLQEATQACEDAKKRADESRERAWHADCVDDPRCMRSRAASLAGLGGMQNPDAPSPGSWNFGMAISRSRSYYAQRLAQEAPKGSDIESVTDSLAREAYYRYALGEVERAWYRELDDGFVDMYLPHLACTKDEVRQTTLYGEQIWPCSQEPGGRTLHSCVSCPGFTGPEAGQDSVAAVDAGAVLLCDACRMDVGDLGSVATISTIANNGYEHYWQIIVEEAQKYAPARNEQAEAERRMKGVAEEGKSAFDRVLDQLRVPRPHIMPPGAWGCVSVVMRDAGTVVPSELTSSIIGGSSLPKGVAVSAAALAPDEASNQNNVLSRFFDGILQEANPVGTGLLGGVASLWGRMLVLYGTAYEGIDSVARSFLDGVDGVFGGTVGSWLKRKLTEVIGALGFEPADMRPRKPVLVGTSEVLRQAGIEKGGKIRALVQAIPSGGLPLQVARALGVWVWDQWTGGEAVVAELPIPGTDRTVPLYVDLAGEGGGLS